MGVMGAAVLDVNSLRLTQARGVDLLAADKGQGMLE